jgi:hypothetical protein
VLVARLEIRQLHVWSCGPQREIRSIQASTVQVGGPDSEGLQCPVPVTGQLTGHFPGTGGTLLQLKPMI